MAGALVAAALGTQKPDGSPDQAATEAALLNATPDQLLALKNAEQAFQVSSMNWASSANSLPTTTPPPTRGRGTRRT